MTMPTPGVAGAPMLAVTAVTMTKMMPAIDSSTPKTWAMNNVATP